MIATINALLPAWLQEEMTQSGTRFETEEARMRYAIALARRNVDEGTGGPFGAALFEAQGGRLISVGVNLVVTSNCSHAHAEMVAIALAEQALGSYSLADLEAGPYALYTSCEPCVMCLGGILWSGVRRVVSAARDADARRIGFDEGPKPENWAEALRSRGIEVREEFCRDEAVAVLRDYAATGGIIYNGR